MPSTIGACAYLGPVPQRNIVRIGGYWYAFYHQPTTHYLVYRSSSDGVNWGAEANASHIAMPTAAYYDMTVFCDGTHIWIAYPGGGTYGSGNVNLFSRRGTPNSGAITWDTQTQFETNRNGYCMFSFAKTANYMFLSYVFHSGTYCIRVIRTTEGSSWTQVYALDPGVYQKPAVAIVRNPNFTDGLLMIQGFWSESNYVFYTYNGTSWSGAGYVGEKTGSKYVFNNSFSLCLANNEIHFVYIPNQDDGGAIRYRYYTTGWSAYTTIDSSTCFGPALAGASNRLYCFHYHSGGTSILFRSMVYSTHSWDGSDTTLASGETGPWYTNSDQYPPAGEAIGVTWISNGNMRFERYNIVMKTFTDTLLITDSFSAVAPYSKTFTDTLHIVDSFHLTKFKTFTDELKITDRAYETSVPGVSFNRFKLPTVQTLDWNEETLYANKPLPGKTLAYRRVYGSAGPIITVRGIIENSEQPQLDALANFERSFIDHLNKPIRGIMLKPTYDRIEKHPNQLAYTVEVMATESVLPEYLLGDDSSPVAFGWFKFPNVTTITYIDESQRTEIPVPGANIAFREAEGATGDAVRITGWFFSAEDLRATMSGLADNILRTFTDGNISFSGRALKPMFLASSEHEDIIEYEIEILESN